MVDFHQMIKHSISKLKNFYYIPLGRYKYETYWKRRGKFYLAEFKGMNRETKTDFTYQEKELLSLLKSLDFDSLLELGCGFGRIFKLIKEEIKKEKELTGIDISYDQIENARRYLAGYPDIKLLVGDILKMKLPNSYDVILTSEVLMHIKNIDPIIEKIKKNAKKYIIHLEYFDEYNDKIKKSKHVFNHDLTRYYQEYNLEFKRLKKQRLYLITTCS